MSSRSTSPDPITLPAPRSGKATRNSSAKPSQPRASKAFASPSKSFIMRTGNASDGSPLRIRVTVEAEPTDDSSPTKRRTRTTKVAVKGGTSSPARRSRSVSKIDALDGAQDEEGQKSHPQKKRKGTPMRRATQMRRDSANNNSDYGDILAPAGSPLQDFTVSSNKSVAGTRLGMAPTERSRRLGQARKELDTAIGNAVGHLDYRATSDQPGDVTVANEDFTMVSVATLQSMKQNQSTLDDSRTGLDETDAVGGSYLPSSPPQPTYPEQPTKGQEVEYPDLSLKAHAVLHQVSENSDYDAMSWKPTGAATVPLFNDKEEATVHYEEPSEWQREREAVSRQIENANTSQIIVIDDDTHPGPLDEGDDDIWAEEASRSLQEYDEINPVQVGSNAKNSAVSPEQSTAEKIQDLFAHQPLKPPRSKIPRTWRRSSGADFSYVDSPEQGALRPRKASSGSNEAEGAGSRSSGVLTPPSTDDEVAVAALRQDQSESLANAPSVDIIPNTLEQAEGLTHGSPALSDDEDASPGALSSPDTDGDDTGLFWQNNLPNVYQKSRPRPKRQFAVDLDEVLGTRRRHIAMEAPAAPTTLEPRNRTQDTAQTSARTNTLFQQTRIGPRDNESQVLHSTKDAKEKIMHSPLRQSLLRSSKIGGSLLSGTPAHFSAPKYKPYVRAGEDEHFVATKHSATAGDDSLGSKAFDQRQLVDGKARESKQANIVINSLDTHLALAGVDGEMSTTEADSIGDDVDDSGEYLSEDHQPGDEEDGEEGKDEPLHSYEEHLNLDSPQKIRVKFNDPEGNSSLLTASKDYAPLFTYAETTPTASEHRKAVASLIPVKEPNSPGAVQPGLLARLSCTFWSAVVRPSGPSTVMPKRSTLANDPEYSPSLRAHIRSRYGVVAESHRWTIAHMRTLHRMHNSCTSNRSDSIIPRTGLLPPYLNSLIGTQHTAVSDFTWKFTSQHAHVVHAFMQVLVPQHFITAMENGEVDFLGDREAKRHRGLILGRHGKDIVFPNDDEYVLVRPKDGTLITMTYVARALGNVILANILTDERNARDGN